MSAPETLPAGGEDPEWAQLADGKQLGRYLLLEELGRGGMGIVVAAYDTELSRKVALKVLKRAERASGRARMVREAQALAKLQHPNVVSVFEVAEVQGTTFVAMEYVEGLTFDRWVKSEPRSWQEVVVVALKAGQGLAAAHAVGLVHRDFKPGNVLVGSHGRVRVVDFGIAIAAASPSTDDGVPEQFSLEQSVERSLERDLVGSLTETGAVLGTPAFMAPEQHVSRLVDAKSDQFAFCVTLYRMLYDRAPFLGDEVTELRRAMRQGEIQPAPEGSEVPTWLRRIIERGLSASPDKRWPSMEALLTQLNRRLRGRMRGRIAVVSTVLGIGLAAVLVAMPSGPALAECEAAQAGVPGVWDDARRAELGAAFDASGLPYAVETFGLAARRLDGRATAWSQLSHEVCEASRAGPSPDHDLQRSCLQRRRDELAAVVEVLSAADPDVVMRATEIVGRLAPIEHCRDAEALRTRLPPPPLPVASQVAEARADIARVDALLAAGGHLEALPVAEQAVTVTEQTGYQPAIVEARDALGRVLYESGRLDEAQELLSDNALAASAIHHDEVAAVSAAKVAFVVGYRKAQHEEGLEWARHAEAAVSRYGRGTLVEAAYQQTIGGIHSFKGDYVAARAALERALEIQKDVLGADHPTLGAMENNLGTVCVLEGKPEEARRHFELALAYFSESYGAHHPRVATALTGLGALYERLGEFDKAIDVHGQALQIRRRAFGDESDDTAMSLDNLGSAHVLAGHYDEAVQYSGRALEIRIASLGPDHPHVASARTNLAIAAQKQGRYEEARSQAEQAIAVFESSLSADHPFIGWPLTTLGLVHLAEGDTAAARATLQRALELREASAPADEVAMTRFALARVLWADGESNAALEHARAAAEVFDGLAREEVVAWIDAHRPSDAG